MHPVALRRRLSGLLLLIAAGPALAAGACSKPIVVGAGEWEPYNFHDAGGRYTGLDVELSRAIVKEAGCVLEETGPIPTRRSVFLFEAGQLDMMMGASYTAERAKMAYFSHPYRQEKVAMYALAGSPHLGVRSFAAFLALPLTLLAPRVGWYGEDYARHAGTLQEQHRLSQFNGMRQGVQMLAAGRSHVILGDAASIEHAAARQGVKVAPLPFLLVSAPVYFMLNKKTLTRADVERLDLAIERLRQRGTLAAIRAAYGNQ